MPCLKLEIAVSVIFECGWAGDEEVSAVNVEAARLAANIASYTAGKYQNDVKKNHQSATQRQKKISNSVFLCIKRCASSHAPPPPAGAVNKSVLLLSNSAARCWRDVDKRQTYSTVQTRLDGANVSLDRSLQELHSRLHYSQTTRTFIAHFL